MNRSLKSGMTSAAETQRRLRRQEVVRRWHAGEIDGATFRQQLEAVTGPVAPSKATPQASRPVKRQSVRAALTEAIATLPPSSPVRVAFETAQAPAPVRPPAPAPVANSPAPMTETRRRQLLEATPLGTAALQRRR